MTLSAIVPVHNGGQKFVRCLASLKNSLKQPDEIIVVVDGATDESERVAYEFGTLVFRLPSARGPARARNFGAAQAKGDLLLFIDADVTIPAHAIQTVASAFEREPHMDALIGSYDDDPAERNFFSQYRNLLHHYVHQQGREDASTFWGACGAIRRDVFLSICGFDEGYVKPSIEDIELGYRLKKAGAHIRLCKSLQVKHLKRWDLGSMLKADFFQRALPWTELIHRDRKLINDLNTTMSARVSVMLTFALVGLLLLSYWQPLFLAGGLGVGTSLLVLNAPLYRFFLRKRGVRFALQSIFWHWAYFLYSGVAFLIGTVRHVLDRRTARGISSPYVRERMDDTESRMGRH